MLLKYEIRALSANRVICVLCLVTSFFSQVMGVLSVYATPLSYVNFIILLYCYMFRSYDHLQVENIYSKTWL
jgi:hypothetical protein